MVDSGTLGVWQVSIQRLQAWQRGRHSLLLSSPLAPRLQLTPRKAVFGEPKVSPTIAKAWLLGFNARGNGFSFQVDFGLQSGKSCYARKFGILLSPSSKTCKAGDRGCQHTRGCILLVGSPGNLAHRCHIWMNLRHCSPQTLVSWRLHLAVYCNIRL